MKAKEVRDLSVNELEVKLDELKEELFNLRFQLATGQLDNPMRISAVRKKHCTGEDCHARTGIEH
jgi:large subunit ribosomal protein L29